MKVISYGNLASEFFIYVDDGRIIENSELVYWHSAKRFFSICYSPEIQDETRKMIELSLTPVPWAVTVAHTSVNEVVITVMEVKWGKKRGVLS